MKNFIFGLALVIVLLTVATGFNQNEGVEKIELGKKISEFTLINDTNRIEIGSKNEFYTLLILWESSDANSRISCSSYASILQKNTHLNQNIKIAQINFDNSVELCDEIIKVDGIDYSNNFRVDTRLSMELKAMFELNKGMCSVLIAPDGTVLAFNPDEKELLTSVESKV